MNTNNSHIYWQPALGRPGRVTGAQAIAQNIRSILTTPVGSDPLRPEFGSNLYRWLDWPVRRALPYIIRDAVQAIARWEPRVRVLKTRLIVRGEQVTLQVNWTLPDGVADSTEVLWR